MQAARQTEHPFFNQQSGSFSILSAEALIVSLSQPLLDATGWVESDWRGKSIYHLIHKDHHALLSESFKKALAGKTVQLENLRCISRRGSYALVDSALVPRIESESVRDILWVNQMAPSKNRTPVVAQSASQLPLYSEKGEQLDVENAGVLGLLQTLLANAPVGVALFDEELKFVCLNQAFSQMTGFSPEQQLGLRLLEVMPRVGLIIEPALKKVITQGHPLTDYEIPMHKFPISEHCRWGLLSFYPIPDGREGMCGVACVAVDITDRKRAERAVRESEDRFRLAVDATNLGTWDLDFQAAKLVWSDRTKAIHGLPSDAVIEATDFLRWLHPKDGKRVGQAFENAKDPKGDGSFQVEYQISTEDKLLRWVSARGKVRFDENGVPIRFIGTLLDITDQKNGEEALKNLSEDLARSNRALSDFAHTASHDLKEPLRMISSFGHLLSTRYKGKLDKGAEEYIEYIRSGASRMGHLIDSILEYARAGRAPLKLEPVNCDTVLKTTLKNLCVSLREANVEISAEPMPLVTGSEDLILQIFQNLISNAIKFRGNARPKIHIGARVDGPNWVFSICDNGIGIRPAYIDMVFSPFKRLHSKSAYEGTGLGLAICRQSVERQGGRIWATSEEGKGANFFFTLPAVTRRKE